MTEASPDQSRIPSGSIPSSARVVLRPLANPLPLGFLGQAVASWSFACLQLGWLSPAQGHTVALGVLLLTVPLQLLASILGFLERDPVAGTGMGLLAGGWAIIAAGTLTSPPGALSPGLGVLLVGVAGAVLLPAAIGVQRMAAALVLLCSVARFAVTGAAELLTSHSWLHAAGWVGLVLAAMSAYAAAAFEIEAATGRARLPIGRLTSPEQDLAAEPGVRPRP